MLHRFVIMVSRRIKILTIFFYDTIMHLIQFQLKMKVFKIPSGGFTVTKTTNLRFTVQIKKEAEGHAICIDEDKNVDPFGGLKMRCVVISGTQFAQWKTAKKHNLAFNKEVTMKGGSSGALYATSLPTLLFTLERISRVNLILDGQTLLSRFLMQAATKYGNRQD